MRKTLFVPFPIIALLVLCFTISADEGMYPLTELGKLNLKAKGLKIDVKEIYNPDGVSLVQAICQVGMGNGGGTGEFVSADGLILTNHHIAFPAVTAASTPENDYLKNGFTAFTRGEEIPARDYTCRIIESMRDVTSEVMGGISPDMPPVERAESIRERMNAIAREEEKQREGVSCEVSEMFPARSYVLFTYRVIRDVRLVYVPPLGVGNFGGETDNWVWPRHTADFSFLRAYVAPDGSPAPYAKENVPFKPKRFIRVSRRGVRENDFVMILGYPGRTYRHKTSHFLRVQEEFQLPILSRRFDWMISVMERAGEGDRARQLKFADDIKSYANAAKNYKGKMQGLKRLKLVAVRENEERSLQAFIDADPGRKAKYGTVLDAIGDVYEQYRRTIAQELAHTFLGRNRLLTMAVILLRATGERDSLPRERAKQQLARIFDETDIAVETSFLARSLVEIADLPSDQRFVTAVDVPVSSVRNREEQVAERITAELAGGIFTEREKLLAAVDLSRESLKTSGGALVRIAEEYLRAGEEIRTRRLAREGELNRLESTLLDVKMLWRKQAFIPDANSTLRFTYGYIRGYSPADATRYTPITTLRGIVEKQTGMEPFDAPRELIDLWASRSYDRSFEDPVLREVPVAILYNMDTTGGNSGSPVLDAYGNLVGVNFDRAYEATVNDYQWSETYSRSIGVDSRFILFVAKYLGKADFLLKELGVQ